MLKYVTYVSTRISLSKYCYFGVVDIDLVPTLGGGGGGGGQGW